MKILRYRIGNLVKPGILDKDGNITLDASSLVKDWDDENVKFRKLYRSKKFDNITLPLVETHDGYAPHVYAKKVLVNLFVLV